MFVHLQAYIKTEAYGYAIIDATKAIELNPKLIKVCKLPCVYALAVAMTDLPSLL